MVTERRITAGMVAHNRQQAEPVEDLRGRVAYLETYNHRGDVWMADPRSGWPRQVTTQPSASPGGAYRGGFLCWLPDGTGLVFVGADDQLWAIADWGGESRQLTALRGRCSAPAVSPDGRKLAFVHSTDRSTDVLVAPMDDKPAGEGDLSILNRSDFAFDPDWSPDGTLVAWHEWDVPSMPWDEGRIVVGRSDGTERRVVDGEQWAVGQPRFSPDGRWLAYVSERTGWLNIWIADTSTWTPRHLVEEAAEHGAPPWRPRLRTFAWSPGGDRIMFVRHQGGSSSLAMVDLDGGDVQRLGHLEGSLGDLSWSRTPVLAAARSDRPRGLVLLDELGRASVLADDGLAGWEGAAMVRAEPVSFPGQDGAEVHALLWRPERPAPYPLLLYCHGGPNGQVRDDWYPSFQYWVERGYGVLAVNYRGSTGFGREFRDALLGEWGVVDVEDSAAAARWVLGEGIARPGQVVAWGGSAGGYLVLMLLALHGELFAGGINLFGVTDLEHLARHTHRFEAHYLDRLVGPLPEAQPIYRERSPIHLVDRLERPLLILQGDQDEAVPLEQSRTIYERLRGRGVEVELAVYPGEGHGFAKVETLLDYLTRMEAFLERVGAGPDAG